MEATDKMKFIQMKKTRALLLIGVFLVLLTGCGRNPILGRWEIDNQVSPVKSTMMGIPMPFAVMEFKKDSVIIGNANSVEVTYKIDGDQITVAAKQTGQGEIYHIIDNGARLKKEISGAGTIIYKKMK